MPVYDRGYTHWEPSGRKAYPAWWTIARRGIAEPLKKRWLLMLVLMAWVPAIVKGGIIYFKLKAGDLADLLSGGWTSVDPEGFLAFIEGQRFFVFVLLAIVGAGLIANDRRDNGLSLYFSRPLGLASYIGGKSLIIMFFYCLVTLLPVIALCLFAYLIAPDATGLELLLLTPLRALVYCVAAGTSLSLVLLAFSAMGTRSIFVMVWWTIVVSGTETIGAIAEGLGKDSVQAVNFLGQYHNAGSLLFGGPARLAVSPWLSLATVLAWTALAALLLRRRIRPVEVVS
jgi:ABC-type transport system involved in multi-copper enzyme maturation permease subunit